MARNSEKAHSMLYRFRAAQAADLGIIDLSRTRRPKAITSVASVAQCEKWRSQVLKDVSRRVTRIQDRALSDTQLRELNDEINRLLREKHVWELQLRNLGGPNYARAARVLDDDGRELPGANKGYRYFGRARDLPGVRELFDRAERAARGEASDDDDMGNPRRRKQARSRAELRARVDASYFGYNLDEAPDTGLLEYEQLRERAARDQFLRLPDDVRGGAGDSAAHGARASESGDAAAWVELPGDQGDGVGWAVPSFAEVNAELLERRKRKLLRAIA